MRKSGSIRSPAGFGERNRLLKQRQAFVYLGALDAERWREADRAFSTAEQEEPPLEGQVDDLVSDLAVGFLRAVVFHKFGPDHQADPADLPEARIADGKVTQSVRVRLAHM